MGNIIKISFRTLDEGGMYMCTQINKIYGKSAIEILNEFGNPNEIPINLHLLLERIGISALPMDFSDLEKKLNKGHILGLVLSDKDNAVIYYSRNDTANRQRFIIAHEIGHICKHLDPSTNDYPYIDWRIAEESTNDKEKMANIFAGELLIPIHKLKEVYLSMPVPSSADLAKIFGTSTNVMEKRLEYLHVSYYNEKGQAVINGISS